MIGFDPGHETGWAIIEVLDKKIDLVDVGTFKPFSVPTATDLVKRVDLVVIEDFRVDPKKARQGAFDRAQNTTSEHIGRIETLCELLGKDSVRQPNTIKPVGYGWSAQKYVPGKKGTHFQDALAHAVYYAVRHLGANPLEKKTKNA